MLGHPRGLLNWKAAVAVRNLEEVIVQVLLNAGASADAVVKAHEGRQLLGDTVQVLHDPHILAWVDGMLSLM